MTSRLSTPQQGLLSRLAESSPLHLSRRSNPWYIDPGGDPIAYSTVLALTRKGLAEHELLGIDEEHVGKSALSITDEGLEALGL